ncbi:hypothetical protein MXMO3_01206 [Maritalea myrionectae]|uniref:Uncharacterized protein n=1 Tax=Maritalea myrionectae TaxID=454601 RepID=A0A2R4MCI2_9HYPH|nr:hypothetical protein [Maritalea myrionectae]AVX03737.1 hypothetical protein MXMO3_01206 [Maritalea myrionectae]
MTFIQLQRRTSILLAPLIFGLSLFGLLHGAVAPDPQIATTFRGTEMIFYGNGLYHDNSLFFAAGFIAQDIIVLFLVTPLICLSIYLMAKERVAGHILNYGVLGFLLYAYASLAFSATYNIAFFGYVLVLSICLFGTFIAHNGVMSCLEKGAFDKAKATLPNKALAIYLVLAGSITVFVWAEPLITALMSNEPPSRLDHYTTKFTEAIDMAIIAPLCMISALLVLRQQLFGFALAIPLLGTIILLLPSISTATFVQLWAGVEFTTPEIVGPIGGFLILGLWALWLMIRMIALLEKQAA